MNELDDCKQKSGICTDLKEIWNMHWFESFHMGGLKYKISEKLIPKQCELKGEWNIGFLNNRDVLIRETLLQDYVHLLSNPTFVSHRITCLLQWERWNGIQCSIPRRTQQQQFHGYFFITSTTSFWEKVIFSLAPTVGKPL